MELARMAVPAVAAVARSQPDEAVVIVGVGGVWEGSTIVRAACRAQVNGGGHEVTWREPAFDPALGAPRVGRATARVRGEVSRGGRRPFVHGVDRRRPTDQGVAPSPS